MRDEGVFSDSFWRELKKIKHKRREVDVDYVISKDREFIDDDEGVKKKTGGYYGELYSDRKEGYENLKYLQDLVKKYNENKKIRKRTTILRIREIMH